MVNCKKCKNLSFSICLLHSLNILEPNQRLYSSVTPSSITHMTQYKHHFIWHLTSVLTPHKVTGYREIKGFCLPTLPNCILSSIARDTSISCLRKLSQLSSLFWSKTKKPSQSRVVHIVNTPWINLLKKDEIRLKTTHIP